MKWPGVAVGRETLPGLDTAAADRKHRSTAAIQTRQEIFSGDLCRLSAVVSFLQDLCDALFTRLLSCHHTHANITQPHENTVSEWFCSNPHTILILFSAFLCGNFKCHSTSKFKYMVKYVNQSWKYHTVSWKHDLIKTLHFLINLKINAKLFPNAIKNNI